METRSNKKIAVIGLKGLPAYGGAAAVGENIISEIKNEYEFTVYSTASHTRLRTGYYNGFKQIVFKKLPFKKINTLYYYIVSAIHAVLFGRYDLIHLHHRDAAFIIPLLKIKYKVIVTTHGSFGVLDKWKHFSWFLKLNEKYFVPKADIVCCVSMNEKRNYKLNTNIEPIYIPNGIRDIDIDSIKNLINKNYIFFAAGRILKSKGLDILLDSLNIISYSGELLIAGDMEQTNNYKKTILSKAKGLNVVFLGLIKEKDLLYSYLYNAKLFVYPSSIEAMSMMLLEAATCKVPIICSDIIENKDVFSDNEVLFFKTNSSDDLAKKIDWAINNPIEMNSKALNAYLKLKQFYSWDSIAHRYSELYKSLK